MDIYCDTSLLSLYIAAISLFVAVIVLFVTYKTYNLKLGQKVRGWMSEAGSIDSSLEFFNSILLENRKDKDLVVYDIFVRIGRNIYLDMLDKDEWNQPYFHIIPALSTKEFRFGPPIEYTDGVSSVDMSDFFNSKVKKTIVLSTNEGKLIVKTNRKEWSPIFYGLERNCATAVVHQIRYYSDRSIYGISEREKLNAAINYDSYGNKILFLVSLKRKGLGQRVYPISNDSNVQYFSKTEFTGEALESVDTLQEFLLNERSNGNLEFEEIDKIIDFRQKVKSIREGLTISKRPLKTLNWFDYSVKGRLQTHLHRRKQSKPTK